MYFRNTIAVAALALVFVAFGRGVDGVKVGMKTNGSLMCEVGSFMPTANDYVQDGLVAIYDGIENAGWNLHSNDLDGWVNLVTKKNTFTDYGNPTWTKLSKDFDANVSRSVSVNAFDWTVGGSDVPFTIELVWKVSSYNSSQNVISIGNISGPFTVAAAINWNGNRVRMQSAFLNVTESISSVGIHNVSACYNGNGTATSYIKGLQDQTVSGITSQGVGSGMILADLYGISSRGGWGFSGSIYCIRIYSRALTSAEVAHNYAIDRARFNLP